MALHDAALGCWDAKYAYFNPRPSQLDPGIKTVIGLPNFPSYTSGHSTFSAAASAVLSYLFPDSAAYFDAQKEEAAISRLYGGIHYRSDIEVGEDHGKQIGGFTVRFAQNDGADGTPSTGGQRRRNAGWRELPFSSHSGEHRCRVSEQHRCGPGSCQYGSAADFPQHFDEIQRFDSRATLLRLAQPGEYTDSLGTARAEFGYTHGYRRQRIERHLLRSSGAIRAGRLQRQPAGKRPGSSDLALSVGEAKSNTVTIALQ